ncbi:MAG: hypothetical protein CML02_09630 [Pseudooceanicola sp.]|jgi:hypothetical protein|nr:hypothetical protein [Pseudooceanicola sp.]|tara:strand:+ start:309 stop:524 length:216 start_codon:yes stop_codon:yes gene_type:complete
MQYSQFAKRGAIVLALLGGLAACGDDPTERALYGGAAGLGVATLTDTNPIVGTAAGAAANMLYCQQYPSKC